MEKMEVSSWENHLFLWAIVHSYVRLPEAKSTMKNHENLHFVQAFSFEAASTRYPGPVLFTTVRYGLECSWCSPPQHLG